MASQRHLRYVIASAAKQSLAPVVTKGHVEIAAAFFGWPRNDIGKPSFGWPRKDMREGD